MGDDVEKKIEEEVETEAVTEGFKFGIKHIAFICSTLIACGPALYRYENNVLKSYRDSGGVWTACEGVAGAIPNHTYTKAECDRMNMKAKIVKVIGVTDKIKVPVTPELAAAHVTFAYNIGLGAYQKSQTLKLTNEGRLAEGCQAMMNFYRAGGMDCRIRANNCYGLITRRQQERDACLKGIK